MKFPTLALFALSLSLPAQAAEQRRNALERAWNHVEDAGADLRDGVAEAGANLRDGVESSVDAFIAGSRDVIHDRPELQMLPHLVALRKGDEIKIAYCRPILTQMFRDRRKHPDHNRCDELLTKGAMKLDDMQACASRHSGRSTVAFNLDRQLMSLSRHDAEYNYNFFAMFDTRDEYRKLFRACAREAAAPLARRETAQPNVPTEQPAEAKPPVFKPAERPHEDAPTEASGTIGG